MNVAKPVTTVDSIELTVNKVCRSMNNDGERYKDKHESQVKCQSVNNSDEVTVKNCECDLTSHVCCTVEELGQSKWLNYSKKQLAQLELKNIQDKCPDLEKYMKQQNQHTGFVPLSPLQFVGIKSCTKCIVNTELCKDPVKLHEYVKQFRCPNFIGARVQVNYDINFELLEHLAQEYWDWQLPLFLKYGLPMDFKGDMSVLKNAETSHASALQFPEHVSMYLNDEIAHKAIYGPEKHKPFGNLTHVSPFITRHKADSQKRRVIIDLSWPENASVNHFTSGIKYVGTAFKLHCPSIDSFTQRLTELGRGLSCIKSTCHEPLDN